MKLRHDVQYDVKSAQILVVDDEPANLKLLSLMLSTEGYHQTKLLADPRDALGCYLAQPPDLVLLDLNMPHLNGFEVLAQFRQRPVALPPPVLVLTAQSGDDYLLEAFKRGASDFLSKPFNRRELMARVENLLLAHLARRMLSDQNAVLEQRVAQSTRALRASRMDIVRRLGRAAEFRDNETGQHVLRMSHMAAILARRAGWSEAACELMLNASPMHDVGKIGVPDGILLKAGALTAHEREVMQKHTVIGAEILSGSGCDLIEMARTIALGHHEKWDGSGYPGGLSAGAIPECARIVAIADVFDALTSERPYKKAWEIDDAMEYMCANAGAHFDARLLDHFIDVLPEVLKVREAYAEPHVQSIDPVDTR